MKQIPKNCIKNFKKRFKIYPSVIRVGLTHNFDREKIDIFFQKYKILWRYEYVDNSTGDISIDKLIDYDSTGIFIYINRSYHIFILTTELNMDVVRLTLSILNKILKENGNNSKTIETKN